ncbi:MAG: alpha/beta hydrolase [Oscillospiraceae bacterium]|nr:alpha/beta hydrolase [Oscillospiraceae bacterium]MCD7927722.1 alpha/beta hydrolase [Oscillospiraceae bacterium]
MVKETTFRFPSCDGEHQIFSRQWMPVQQPLRGVVQLVHGVSEYIDRYAPTARFLAQQGFVVVGSDHLGHGRTAAGPEEYGFFCHQRGWHTVSADVRRLRTLAGERYPELPYFILGHSMGSFLTRTYLIDWPGTVTGAILSGTGQEPAAAVSLGWHMANVVCRTRGERTHSRLIEKLSFGAYNRQFSPCRTPSDWISRDEAVVDAYRADPLCQFLPTAGMFRDMMEGLQYIADRDNLRKMDPATPVLFFSGDQDPVGQNGAGVDKVASWFRQAGAEDVTVHLYPGGRHEMLNEINREQVLADLLAWLEQHLPSPEDGQ